MAHEHHDHAGHDHDHTHDEHHGGVKKFLFVFAGLLVLTVISVFVGSNAHLKETVPQVAWATMMAVSCGKALLVMLFFMHLIWEANWKYVLTIPASIMSIFLILMLVPDVGDRTRLYSEERSINAAEPRVKEHAESEQEHAEHPAEHAHPK